MFKTTDVPKYGCDRHYETVCVPCFCFGHWNLEHSDLFEIWFFENWDLNCNYFHPLRGHNLMPRAWPAKRGSAGGDLLLRLKNKIQGHPEGPDGDGRICNVKSGPVILSRMEVQEIDDLSHTNPVDQIADRPAEDQ